MTTQGSRCFLLPQKWKHAAHAFVHWPTVQWMFALRRHVWWELTCILLGSLILKRWFPELASRSGLLVRSTSELNKWTNSFQGLVGFTSNYWSSEGSFWPENTQSQRELRSLALLHHCRRKGEGQFIPQITLLSQASQACTTMAWRLKLCCVIFPHFKF